jgi:hypothetical protein
MFHNLSIWLTYLINQPLESQCPIFTSKNENNTFHNIKNSLKKLSKNKIHVAVVGHYTVFLYIYIFLIFFNIFSSQIFMGIFVFIG